VSSSVEACPSTVTRIGNAARVGRGGREAAGVAGGEKIVRAASAEKLKSPEHDPRSATARRYRGVQCTPTSTRAFLARNGEFECRGVPLDRDAHRKRRARQSRRSRSGGCRGVVKGEYARPVMKNRKVPSTIRDPRTARSRAPRGCRRLPRARP